MQIVINIKKNTMDKIRLSTTLSEALNIQMTKEAHASQIYLAYGSWAASQGFGGISNFLFRHAQEERNHMMKILEYILKRCADVHVAVIPAPPANPATIHSCFEKVFEHEVDNTKGIYKLVKMSFEEEDWATWSFMQWFVNEQVEEETLALNLIDKLKMAGGEKASSYALYSFDRDLEKASDKSVSAQDVTAENP